MAKLLKMESHTEWLMPFFNRSNNPDLILATQSAGGSWGRNGFRKDKSGEKLAESEEDLLEHRPLAPTLSIPSISVARNSLSEISWECQWVAFSNSLTINPLKTKFCFAPDIASFPFKRCDVIVFISARKLCFLPFFASKVKNNMMIVLHITFYDYLCTALEIKYYGKDWLS